MTADNATYNYTLGKFANKRQKAEEVAEQRKSQIYGLLPRIAEIDKEIKSIKVDLINNVLKGNTSQKNIRQLKKRSIDLQAERAELLVTNGFPMDYLAIKYECPDCNDTGFVGTKRCSCFETELKKESYYRSNLGAALSHQTFENFILEYYSDEQSKEYKMSPRQNMEKTLQFCKDYVKKFSENSHNLIFIGGTGLGKTFMSSCIAKGVIDKGYSVVYDCAQNIITTLENQQFGRDNGQNNPEKYYSADLLIVDDLGAEFITSFSQSSFFNLLNTRIIANKPMIISTNLTHKELDTTYHDRIVSRLGSEFIAFLFFGTDLRKIVSDKAKKKKT